MSVVRRLGIGVAKGLGLGILLGVGFHAGLGWQTTTGLLSTLLAMGAGATAGAFAGRPPWEQSGWLEGALRVLAGAGLGASLIFVANRYLSFVLPFSVLGAPSETLWNELPILYVPYVTTIYGAVLELDNDGAPARGGKPGGRAGRPAGSSVDVPL